MNDFKTYLYSKKIDAEKFNSKRPDQFREFEFLFNQMHPNSFTTQKLFLLNSIRREFPYNSITEQHVKPNKSKVKPKISPRIKK